MRTPGVEPGSQAWEACMMPLHYVRSQHYGQIPRFLCKTCPPEPACPETCKGPNDGSAPGCRSWRAVSCAVVGQPPGGSLMQRSRPWRPGVSGRQLMSHFLSPPPSSACPPANARAPGFETELQTTTENCSKRVGEGPARCEGIACTRALKRCGSALPRVTCRALHR